MARNVVEPLAGSVAFTRNGDALAEPIGLKSCVNRTLAPASFARSTASIGTVPPATGDLPSPMRNVAISGPRVSRVANRATNGSPAARLPARSKILLAVSVKVVFTASAASGVKLIMSPFKPTLATPGTAPFGPISRTTKFELRIGSLNESRITARGSIWS